MEQNCSLAGPGWFNTARSTLLLAALLQIGNPGVATAQQQRIVIVNGQVLNRADLAEVDALNCGDRVPNGRYWLDLQRGEWGYVGDGIRRPLPRCSERQVQSGRQARSDSSSECARRYPLYEDRMCYCYNACNMLR